MVAIKSTISPFRIFGRLGEAILLDPLDTVRYANPCEVVILPTNNNRIGHIEEDNYEEETNNPSLGGERGGIYPNPNNGNFTLTYTLKEDAVLEVYNSFGQLVMSESLKAKSNKKEISLNQVNGIYFYSVKTSTKQIANGKLVVQ